jgi:Glycosyl hydrolase family 76
MASYEAMTRYFYIQGSGLYREEVNTAPYAFLFPFSQALAATVSASHIPRQAQKLTANLRAQLHGLQKYFKSAGSPASPAQSPQATLASYTAAESGGTSYFDDNEWVGIELVRVYELDHDREALAQAEQIMSFVMAGWQTNPKERCPGGVPFSDSAPGDTERNAVTNGPAAELGVQLFRITHNVAYLQFAEMAYGWVRTCLLEPTNLYADHLEGGEEAEVEPTEWSYKQGSMIGAGALLYQSTRQPFYLEQAIGTARAAVANFPVERLAGESPFFPAVFFRNLLYLDSLTHESTARGLAQSYVDYVWESLRLGSGLYLLGNGDNPQLLEQASIAQIYALLSIAPSSYF